jgi:hypothetical protein
MNGNDTGRNHGAFRLASQSVTQSVAVDGSEWNRQVGPRTAGTFGRATKSVPTPILVDAAEWVAPRLAAVTEELTVLLESLNGEQKVQAVETLISALNEKHQLNLTLTRKTA